MSICEECATEGVTLYRTQCFCVLCADCLADLYHASRVTDGSSAGRKRTLTFEAVPSGVLVTCAEHPLMALVCETPLKAFEAASSLADEMDKHSDRTGMIDDPSIETAAAAAYETDRQLQAHGVPWRKLGKGARDRWRAIARAVAAELSNCRSGTEPRAPRRS